MKHPIRHASSLLGLAIATALAAGCAPATVSKDDAAFDAAAAKTLAAEDRCLRCHGLTKKKEGPPYAEIAAKYRSRPDAETALYTHLTAGEGPVMPDGQKQPHRVIKAQHPEDIKNLVRWILSQ
jgi:cytochrome c551/c552